MSFVLSSLKHIRQDDNGLKENSEFVNKGFMV